MNLFKQLSAVIFWSMMAPGPSVAGPSYPYAPAPGYAPEAPWCTDRSNIASTPDPRGAVVEIGPFKFRTCYWNRPGNVADAAKIGFNPAAAEGIRFAYTLRTLSIHSRGTWVKYARMIRDRYQLSGSETFGGYEYKSFKLKPAANSAPSRMVIYYFDGGGRSSEAPPNHTISCWGDPFGDSDRSVSCHFVIDYNGLLARIQFIGYGGRYWPLPVHLFPDFAADTVRALDASRLGAERWISQAD